MKLIKTIHELREVLNAERRSGKSIGFVPTLGCLHRGHLLLANRAREANDVVVVSIFVNPIQFGTDEFSTYPRTLQRDCELLQTVPVDYVFAPEEPEMYPQPLQSFVEVPALGRALHEQLEWDDFRGVATVVAKLFNIVQPTRAYFGEKDYQQLQVVRRLAADLSFPVEVVGVPTVRDADGLALSSRNTRLSPAERGAAACLARALAAGSRAVTERKLTTSRELEACVATEICAEPLAKIEVVAVRDAATLQVVERLSSRVVVIVFARFGDVQLLDQAVIDVPGPTGRSQAASAAPDGDRAEAALDLR